MEDEDEPGPDNGPRVSWAEWQKLPIASHNCKMRLDTKFLKGLRVKERGMEAE